MTTKPVVMHRLAKRDAAVVYHWYKVESQSKAEAFITQLENALLSIEQRPMSFPWHMGEARRCLLTSYPYKVVFRETNDEWLVLTVSHTSRRPGHWRNRWYRP